MNRRSNGMIGRSQFETLNIRHGVVASNRQVPGLSRVFPKEQKNLEISKVERASKSSSCNIAKQLICNSFQDFLHDLLTGNDFLMKEGDR